MTQINKDTGSAKAQIELLNERISNLKLHFTVHKKDKHSRKGLIALINKKNKLLKYIKLNEK